MYCVIIQAKKKMTVACTIIVAEQMARSCGFWIYLEGRIDRICLRIGYGVSERKKKRSEKMMLNIFSLNNWNDGIAIS